MTVADWPTILIFCSYWLVAAWHTIGWHIVSSYFIGPMVVALVNYALGTRDFTMLCKIPVGKAYIREHSYAVPLVFPEIKHIEFVQEIFHMQCLV